MTRQTTDQQNEIDLRDLLHTYLKNWYWFALSVTLCVGLAILYYFKKTPVFEVSSTIMIRESESGGLSGLANMDALNILGMGSSKSVTDELEIYGSRSIMQEALRSLELQTEYRKKKNLRWIGQYPGYDLTVRYPQQFCDTMSRGVHIQLHYKGDRWKLKVKYGEHYLKSSHTLLTLDEPVETCIGTLEFNLLRPVKKGARYRISTTPMPYLVDAYRTAVTAKQVKKGSNIVTVSTTTDMPRRAQAVIGKLTELYNFDAVLDKTTTTQNTARFLQERLAKIQLELDSAEMAVERYKKAHDITSLTDEAALWLEGAGEYQKAMAETETQLNLIDYIRQFVSDDANLHSPIPANLGITDASLVALISNYNSLLLKKMRLARSATEQNPAIAQIEEQLTVMRTNILTSIASVRDGLLITKADLQRQQDMFTSRVGNIPQQEREYVILKRQQQIKQTIYIFLYQKQQENDLALISTVTPTRLIDKPQTTPEPVAPRLKLLLLLAIIIGGGIPIGILFLRDLLYNKITGIKQYTELLSAPVIGGLPRFHRNRGQLFTDTTRMLCSNLRFRLPEQKAGVIMVTSCVSGEGKSFVALNIAQQLAHSGKTILVECNLRKPVFQNMLATGRCNTLNVYLADSEDDLRSFVFPAPDGYDLIPADGTPADSEPLLRSERLDQLVSRLKETYDYIILDTAPVTMVADAFLLNRLTDLTLFVSRDRYTACDNTDVINALYEQKRLNNIVCVLNDLKDMPDGYGY